MELPLDLHTMPTLWQVTTLRLASGRLFRIYEDPSRQLTCLTPVADLGTIRQWWEQNASIPQVRRSMETVEEGFRLRDLMRSQRPKEGRELLSVNTLEEWWIRD